MIFIYYSLPVMFGSTLGLWAIHSMVPGHPGSVEHGLFLMAWASSSIMHWLATPTSSFPPLPQHIFRAKEIVNGWFVAGMVYSVFFH